MRGARHALPDARTHPRPPIHPPTHHRCPGAEEIMSIKTWLNTACGIPNEAMVGFRSPFLINNPEIRAILSKNGAPREWMRRVVNRGGRVGVRGCWRLRETLVPLRASPLHPPLRPRRHPLRLRHQ